MLPLPESFSNEGSGGSARGLSQYALVATEHSHQDYLDISSLPADFQKAFANFDVDKDGWIKEEDLLLAGQLLKQQRLQLQHLNKLNLVGIFMALILAAFGGSYAALDIHKDSASNSVNTTMAFGNAVHGVSNEVVDKENGCQVVQSGPVIIDSWRNPIQVERATYFIPVRSFAKFPLLSSAALDAIESLNVRSNGTEFSFKLVGFELYGIDDQDDRIVCLQTASRQVVIITVTGMVFLVNEGQWHDVASQLRLAYSQRASNATISSDRRLNILQDIGNWLKNVVTTIVDVTVDLFNAIIGGFKAVGNWVADEWNKVTR